MRLLHYAFMAAALAPQLSAALPGDPEPLAECPGPGPLRQAIERHINMLRSGSRSCGNQELPPAPPLRWNHQLSEAAARHAADMARRGYFSHDTPEGLTPGRRGEAAGYDWRLYGENIGSGQTSVAAVLDAWLASPTHCHALMNPAFRDAALACAPAPDGLLWALELGRPR